MASTAMVPTASAGSQLSKPLLLVSDLDDTLLGHGTTAHDSSSATFKTVWERSRALGIPCKLAINTGRTLPLFEEAWHQRQHLLPQPDIIVAGVGTRVYYNTLQGWVEDRTWTQRMSTGWSSSTAKQVMDDLMTLFGADSVVYREAVEMHEHKLTVLYLAVLRDQLLAKLHKALDEAGLQATVIEGGSANPWRFIDLVPKHAGKGSALQYVRQQFAFDEASTVAAGDSCNDLLMLQQCKLSIVVGNGVAEVKQWANRLQQEQQADTTDRSRRQQQEQQVVYVAKQSVAAGVLEGLAALGFLNNQGMN